MKKIYLLLSFERNGKQFADVVGVNRDDNLLNYLLFLKKEGADFCRICRNKTEAEQLAEVWNNDYKKKNTFLSSF